MHSLKIVLLCKKLITKFLSLSFYIFYFILYLYYCYYIIIFCMLLLYFILCYCIILFLYFVVIVLLEIVRFVGIEILILPPSFPFPHVPQHHHHLPLTLLLQQQSQVHLFQFFSHYNSLPESISLFEYQTFASCLLNMRNYFLPPIFSVPNQQVLQGCPLLCLEFDARQEGQTIGFGVPWSVLGVPEVMCVVPSALPGC